MISLRSTQKSAIVGISVVTCLFIAAMCQVFNQQGGALLAADILNPIAQEIDAFLVTQLADATAAAEQFSPTALPLATQGNNQILNDVEELTQIEQRLWAALLLNDHRRDHQSDQIIYADTSGRFVAVWQLAAGHFRFSRRTLKEDPPAYRPSSARVIELKPLPRNFDPRTRPWYRHAVDQGKLSWVPVFTNYETGKPKQMLAMPLYHKDGNLKGVVAFDIDLTALTNKLSRTLTPKGAAAYLVNETGQIITIAGATLLASEFGPILATTSSPTKSGGPNPISPAPVSFTSDGRTYWVVKQPIIGPANPNWQLIVTSPQSALVSLWWQQQGKYWVLPVAGMLLLPLLAFVLIKRQLQRLAELKDLVSLAVADHPAEAIRMDTKQQVQEIKDKVTRRLRTDRLTGVLNRETFVTQVRSRCANLSLFEPNQFSLLFIDLNGFKAVNDTHGHHAGDQVLKIAAGRMKQQLHRDDAIARFGGDEFVIYLHGADDLASVEATCDKLQRLLAEPIALANSVTAIIGCAIGMACYPHDGEDLDTLMAKADERMYAAKRAMKRQDKSTSTHELATAFDAIIDTTIEIDAKQRHARTQPRTGHPQEMSSRTVRGLSEETALTRSVKISPDQINVRWAVPTFSLHKQAEEKPLLPSQYYSPTVLTDHAPSSSQHHG